MCPFLGELFLSRGIDVSQSPPAGNAYNILSRDLELSDYEDEIPSSAIPSTSSIKLVDYSDSKSNDSESDDSDSDSESESSDNDDDNNDNVGNNNDNNNSDNSGFDSSDSLNLDSESESDLDLSSNNNNGCVDNLYIGGGVFNFNDDYFELPRERLNLTKYVNIRESFRHLVKFTTRHHNFKITLKKNHPPVNDRET